MRTDSPNVADTATPIIARRQLRVEFQVDDHRFIWTGHAKHAAEATAKAVASLKGDPLFNMTRAQIVVVREASAADLS